MFHMSKIFKLFWKHYTYIQQSTENERNIKQKKFYIGSLK